MDDLIRIHEALEKINERAREAFRLDDGYGYYFGALHDVANDLRQMPTIDAVPAWIPVTERLPENGAEVLAWSGSGFAYVDWWLDSKWKVNSLVDGEYEHVTHWMPLPEPPKGEREGDASHPFADDVMMGERKDDE